LIVPLQLAELRYDGSFNDLVHGVENLSVLARLRMMLRTYTVVCELVHVGEGSVKPDELLRRHHLLGMLQPPEMSELLRAARTRRYAAGATIFHKGDSGDGLYGVLAGRIAVVANSASGKELILNSFAAGEFFGEIALLDGKGRTATAMARVASDLLFIGRSTFLPFLEQHPAVAARLIALLCERLRRTTELVEDSTFLNVGVRLAKGLIGLAGRDGHSVGNDSIELAISQSELAAMLGVTREIVSRQLAHWRSAGLLTLGRGRIALRDRHALARIVHGE
jgi:CRP/FNR family transcriptional regulator, cyclic AMP receptor protein